MSEYKPRIADGILREKLEAIGAVLVEGPKACGKTTTAEQQAKSVLYMNDPMRRMQYMQMVETDINTLLDGAVPRLIDEWQTAPQFWDAIRFTVDHRDGDGQFILTGSAVPVINNGQIEHTGPGRFGGVKMRAMSLGESGAAYVDNVNRDSDLAKRLLRSYARHQGAQASVPTIRKDIAVNESDSVSDVTVESYLSALRKIFVIEDMPAWNPNLRSKTAIRTSDTRYFVDSSIAAAALGIGPKDLIEDLNTFGLLFETLCVRDLRVFADALGGTVYHFRDKNGLECDAVIHLKNGNYGLVEIKLGGDTLIEAGALTLTSLAGKIDTTKMKKPAFLMVLTGVGDFAYRRKDGIYVVPIGCLKD